MGARPADEASLISRGANGTLRAVRNRTFLLPSPALLTLGLPLLVLVLLPLIGLASHASPGLLLQHLRDDLTLSALRLSLSTSAVSALLIVVFGTPLACLLARKHFGGRKVLSAILDCVLVMPPAVAGVGLLVVFNRAGFPGAWFEKFGVQIPSTALAVVLAQIFVSFPYFVRTAAATLASIDPQLGEAARLDGANGFQVFRHIVMPLASRGFLAGAAMAWARALGEFGATLIFAGNFPGRTQTLPLAIFSGAETGPDRAVVVAIILLVLSFGFLFLIRSLTKRGAIESGTPSGTTVTPLAKRTCF